MIPTWANMLAVLKKIRSDASDLEASYTNHRGICAMARWGMQELLFGSTDDDEWDGGTEARNWADNALPALFKDLGYDTVYPIFDDTNEDYASPMAQYDYLPHWRGRQLELRIELLDKCINYLEAGNEPVV